MNFKSPVDVALASQPRPAAHGTPADFFAGLTVPTGGAVLTPETPAPSPKESEFGWLEPVKPTETKGTENIAAVQKILGIEPKETPSTKTDVTPTQSAFDVKSFMESMTDPFNKQFDLGNMSKAFDDMINKGELHVQDVSIPENFEEMLEQSDFSGITQMIRESQIQAQRGATLQTMGMLKAMLPALFESYTQQFISARDNANKTSAVQTEVAAKAPDKQTAVVMNMLAQKYLEHNPEASAAEVAENVSSYIDSLKNNKDENTHAFAKEIDWSKVQFNDL